MTETSTQHPADVQGHCPACGGSSLFLASGGYVTCRVIDCPNPTAVSDLLADREIEHLVTFTELDFTIRHPLIERLDGAGLEDCPLHRHCMSFAGPPVQPGRYRARRDGEGWEWELLA